VIEEPFDETAPLVDDVESEEIDMSEDDIDEYEGQVVANEQPERVAFLTIDDGPTDFTLALLDVLYEEDVPAIFFLWGDRIVNRLPDSQAWLKRILEEGHYIGLHTMTHDHDHLYVGSGAADRFVAEMLELQELIYDLTDHHTYLCRAAYGMVTGFRPGSGHAEAVQDAGLKCIDWNIDPKDWYINHSAQDVYEQVVHQVRLLDFPPELVIVLHEYQRTVEALPAIIAFLQEHGYVFKTYVPGYEFIYQQYRQ